jgi:hypothetical protein
VKAVGLNERKQMKVTVNFKSGNKSVVRFVKDIDYKYNNEQITSISVTYTKMGQIIRSLGLVKMLAVQSVTLSQIEFIEIN